MFGSAGRTPAINGGMRGGFREGNDDEDDDHEGGAGLSRNAISLDQVGNLTTDEGRSSLKNRLDESLLNLSFERGYCNLLSEGNETDGKYDLTKASWREADGHDNQKQPLAPLAVPRFCSL